MSSNSKSIYEYQLGLRPETEDEIAAAIAASAITIGEVLEEKLGEIVNALKQIEREVR